MGITFGGRLKAPNGKLKLFPSRESYEAHLPLPYQVALLCHFEGANNSTTFIDSSSFGHTISILSSDPVISTAQFNVGSSSLHLDGGDSLSIPHNDIFNFTTEDFTIELWARPTSNASIARLITKDDGIPYTPFLIYRDTTNWRFFSSLGGASWDVVNALSIGTSTLNTWQHLAVTRQGDTFRAFKNGTLTGTATSSSAVMTNTATVKIGQYSGGGQFFTGYLDEIRITYGLARYTENFTPSTTPFPDE